MKKRSYYMVSKNIKIVKSEYYKKRHDFDEENDNDSRELSFFKSRFILCLYHKCVSAEI